MSDIADEHGIPPNRLDPDGTCGIGWVFRHLIDGTRPHQRWQPDGIGLKVVARYPTGTASGWSS